MDAGPVVRVCSVTHDCVVARRLHADADVFVRVCVVACDCVVARRIQADAVVVVRCSVVVYCVVIGISDVDAVRVTDVRIIYDDVIVAGNEEGNTMKIIAAIIVFNDV